MDQEGVLLLTLMLLLTLAGACFCAMVDGYDTV